MHEKNDWKKNGKKKVSLRNGPSNNRCCAYAWGEGGGDNVVIETTVCYAYIAWEKRKKDWKEEEEKREPQEMVPTTSGVVHMHE